MPWNFARRMYLLVKRKRQDKELNEKERSNHREDDE